MATDTLQLYWDLASLDPQARLQSAQSLIRVLARFQKDHEAKFDTLPDTIDTEEQLDAACAPDVSYAIRRLLRGLPSSRQGSRQGFSLALTEVLGRLFHPILFIMFLTCQLNPTQSNPFRSCPSQLSFLP